MAHQHSVLNVSINVEEVKKTDKNKL